MTLNLKLTVCKDALDNLDSIPLATMSENIWVPYVLLLNLYFSLNVLRKKIKTEFLLPCFNVFIG